MVARLSAFVIWALVAATAVFWGLRLMVRSPSAPPAAVAVGDVAAVRVDLTRLLGAVPVAAAVPVAVAEASSRFRLLGIMAPKASASVDRAHGVALIAVDGKPPKAYPVGAVLDGDLVLQSVSLRTAAIGPAKGGPTLTLELPPLPAAATGTLSAPGAAFAAPGMPPRMSAQLVPQALPVPNSGVPQTNLPAQMPRDPQGLPSQ
jgi:general secretion pathway protein C